MPNHEQLYIISPENNQPTDFSVLPSRKFLPALRKDVARARKRVVIKTMILRPNDGLKPLIETLAEAGKKGVNVTIQYDDYSLVAGSGIICSPQSRERKNEISISLEKMHQDLTKAGCSVSVTNPAEGLSRVLPFLERDHVKIFVADNTVYLTGMNLMGNNFEGLDFALRLQAPNLATALELFTTQGPDSDECHQHLKKHHLERGIEILHDSGSRQPSTVIEAARSIIKKAETEIFLASMIPPAGKLLDDLLTASQRGVKVTLVNAARWPLKDLTPARAGKQLLSSAYNQAIKYRADTSQWQNWHPSLTTHGKLLLVDNSAILGSSDFNPLLAVFGTRELSFLTKDSSLVAALYGFARDLISTN